KDIRSLSDKAKIATSAKEYLESLGGGDTEKLDELRDIWSVDSETAFSWLRRSDFRTESQPAIESAISTFSDLYFFNSGNVFETLREFLEKNINVEVTTEAVRKDADLRTAL